MCINTTKSRNKCHNVVDLLGDEDMPLMTPRKGGGTPFYAEQGVLPGRPSNNKIR